MDFVALDFETANEKRNSPCSLGITVVIQSQIVLEKYWLIRPKDLRFNPMNIWIHGIREGDVAGEKEFDALWPEILPYLEDSLIVAHNASFDMSVLRSTLDLYGIPYPKLDYCCTMVMSRHFYSELGDAKLGTVSAHLGHKFHHHHASSDATACAHILLRIAEELGTDCIHELSGQIGVGIGKIFERSYLPPKSKSGVSSTIRQKSSCLSSSNTYLVNESCDFFKGKKVAFTGSLSSMTRSKAIGIVEQLGGDYTPSVTLKTNLVVTAMKDPHTLTPDQMSTKLRRAMELISRGQAIEFLTEKEFLDHLS